MKTDLLYLAHIQECIDRIDEFCSGKRQQFYDSILVQDAVLRNLHTLSESSTRVSSDLQSKHPEVPWDAPRAFRNVVVHDYLGIDLDEIWGIIEDDLPALAATVRQMLAELR